MKKSASWLVLALLAGCSSTPTGEDGANASFVSSGAGAQTAAVASVGSAVDKAAAAAAVIYINSRSDFAENAMIADNVRAECTEVGTVLSNAVVKYGAEQGLAVNAAADVTPASADKVVKVSILGMFSGGSAFIGHRKSATVRAELYQDGALVSSKDFTRNSGGGFMGGFKGSCDVLEHTVNTLGNDVAKWLNNSQV